MIDSDFFKQWFCRVFNIISINIIEENILSYLTAITKR